MSRGMKWLIPGIALIVISFVLAMAAQQYVWSSNLGPEMFESIQQTRIIYMIAGLARFIGIGATIAGGVICIVDSKPNRQADGV